MAAPFPLTPVPSYYAECSFPSGSQYGVFYVGGVAPEIILSQATPTAYEVYDYYGNTVSSGPVSGTSCTPTAPAGGWLCGWYRIYFTGTETDTLFGPAYGSTNFCVLNNDSRFLPMPATSTYRYAGVTEPPSPVVKGVFDFGPTRLQIGNVTSLNSGGDQLGYLETNITAFENYWTDSGYPDPARPRDLWVQFPNGTVDALNLPATSGVWLWAYAATGTLAAAGNNLYVSLSAGSVSGSKITVYYPNTETTVETWDNLPDHTTAQNTVNASSSYIQVFVPSSGAGNTASTLSATAIGNAHWAGVQTVVSTVYPSVSYFEGPRNEPPLDTEYAHQMMIFQAAVHGAESGAYAMGPCPVSIDPPYSGTWIPFLNACETQGVFPQVISFHCYGAIVANLNQGRYNISQFIALLDSYGLGENMLWQTEANSVETNLFGVFVPRSSRYALLNSLLWEQYGIPREHNPYWYDWSHSFWGIPTWFNNMDLSINPVAMLYRILAEQTFGMLHNEILDFGSPGNNIFLGSIYATPDGGPSTVVLMAASYMPNATVTLQVTGATGSLTVVTQMGAISTSTINSTGLVTVPASDITYVQLPTGATASVYSWNNGPQVNAYGEGADSAILAADTLGGASTTLLNDQQFIVAAFSGGTLPGDTAELIWQTASRVDRVVVFAGTLTATQSTLTDFEVQTSVDGSTWITQATVTQEASSFNFGADQKGTGCQYETYWPAQWIFDVPFTTPVVCKGVRLYVTSTSYGCMPDYQSAVAAGGGGGANTSQQVVLIEMYAMCDANTYPEYVTAGP